MNQYQFAERVVGSLLLTAKGKNLRKPRNKPIEKANQKSKNEGPDPAETPSGSTLDWTKKAEEPKASARKQDFSANTSTSEQEKSKEDDHPNLPGLGSLPQLPPRSAQPKREKKEPRPKVVDHRIEIPGLEKTTEEIREVLNSDFQKINDWLGHPFIKLANAPREAERRHRFEAEYHLQGPIKHTDKIVETLERANDFVPEFYQKLRKLINKLPFFERKQDELQCFGDLKRLLRHFPLKWPLPVAKMIGEAV